jgi:hypothetical protein
MIHYTPETVIYEGIPQYSGQIDPNAPGNHDGPHRISWLYFFAMVSSMLAAGVNGTSLCAM